MDIPKKTLSNKTIKGTFKAIPGIKGKIFIPSHDHNTLKKHPCKDCFSCQQCGDDRCQVCRSGQAKTN